MIEHLQVSNNDLRERYVHGPGTDEPIARYAHTSLSSYTRSYYAVDHRGSIIGQTQGSASLGTNSYDAYGRPDSGNTGLYQYTGQIWLADLELYYYKARFYDPKIRRFLNTDPSGMSGCKPGEDCIVVTGQRGWNENSISPEDFRILYPQFFDTGVIDLSEVRAMFEEGAAIGAKAAKDNNPCASGKPLRTRAGYKEYDVGGKGTSNRPRFFGLRLRSVEGPYRTFGDAAYQAGHRVHRFTGNNRAIIAGTRIMERSDGYYFQGQPTSNNGGYSQSSNTGSNTWNGQIDSVTTLRNRGFLGGTIHIETGKGVYNSLTNSYDFPIIFCEAR